MLVKPEPRPEVERLALEGSERESARRIEAGMGAIVDVIEVSLVMNSKASSQYRRARSR